MCNAIRPNVIVVFNNINKVGVSEQGVTKAGLLKAFNKAKMQNQGRLLIITANNREKVFKALIQKGRINKKYLFSNISKA
jgi:hypothetical protein